MSSVVIPSRDLCFLHVPKTAGAAISTALRETFPDAVAHPARALDETAPGAATWLAEAIGPDALRRLRTFCVVRNPWDWMVSAYAFLTRTCRAYGDTPPDFARFVTGAGADSARRNPYPEKFATARAAIRYHAHLPQHAHLSVHGRPAEVTRILRFERLDQDLADLIRDFDLPEIAVPHLNRSPRGDYRRYYDDALQRTVARINAPLIARFGHRFDPIEGD